MYELNEYRAKGRSEALSTLGGIRDGAPVRVDGSSSGGFIDSMTVQAIKTDER